MVAAGIKGFPKKLISVLLMIPTLQSSGELDQCLTPDLLEQERRIVCSFSPGTVHRFEITEGNNLAVVLRRQGNQPTLLISHTGRELTLGSWGGEEGEMRAKLFEGRNTLEISPVERQFRSATYEIELREMDPSDLLEVAATESFGFGLDQHYRAYSNTGGNTVAARQHLTNAFAWWGSSVDRNGEAIAAFELAVLEKNDGNLSRATDLLLRASEIWASQGDQREALALNLLGLTEWQRGNLRQASDYFSKALILRENLGWVDRIAQVHNNLGLISIDMGNFRAAIISFESAIRLFLNAQLPIDEQRESYKVNWVTSPAALSKIGELPLNYVLPTINNLALAYDAIGDSHSAAILWHFYLRRSPDVSDSNALAMAHQNLGNNYFHRGNFDLALQYLREAKRRFEVSGDTYGLGYAEHNLGRLHASWGRDDVAELHFESALKSRSEEKYALRRSETLLEYARLNARNGDVEGASKRIEQAISLADAAGLEAVMVKALAARASLAILDIDYTKALDAVELAIAAGASKASVRVLAALQLAKGEALIGLGHYAEAVNELQVSVKRFRSSWMAIDEAKATIALATAHRRGGEYRPAVMAANAAIVSIERDRQRVMSPTSRAEYFSSLRQAYFERAAAEVGLGNVKQAWRIAQDSRSRTFNDQLALEKSVLQSADAVALRERLNAKANALQEASDGTAEHEALMNELAAISRDWDDLLAEHMRESVYASEVHSVDPKDWVDRLGNNEAIVEFLLTDEEGLAFEVSKAGVSARPIAGNKQLNTLVNRVNESLLTGGRLDGIAARDLSHELFENVGLRATTLLLIPDGVLNNVPFALLPDPAAEFRSPLISRRALAVASAVTHLRQDGDRGGWNSIAVAAAPLAETKLPVQQTAAVFRSSLELTPLRFAMEEARMIETLPFDGPSIVVTGSAANRTAVTSDQFATADILHFATHAVSNNLVPEASGILLASDGDTGWDFLRLLDIQSSRIAAELVVLSACETGTGKLVDGEGALSLARAFQLAGAGGVVSSMWRVDDRATLRFMEFFYQALILDELAPAHALRFAQLELMKSAEMRNPFYWAAFTYQGNPFGR